MRGAQGRPKLSPSRLPQIDEAISARSGVASEVLSVRLACRSQVKERRSNFFCQAGVIERRIQRHRFFDDQVLKHQHHLLGVVVVAGVEDAD